MWLPLDSWIVVTGVLCGMSCALLGNFLVLRRMSMMGDAISHAVLPGLALGWLLTGSRANLPMLVGAILAGLLAAVMTQAIHRQGKVDEHASMGVVFTTLFALGLILVVRAADSIDLDPGCVLYGAIELAPLDMVTLAGITLPRAAWLNGAGLVVNGMVVVLLYKEFKITSFDPSLADAMGISSNRMHYLLMVMVAVTTVLAFETVGSILVVAMLIVPAATAYQLTDRLGVMIGLSLVVAGVSAGLGHVAAITVPTWFGFEDTSTAGSMATVGGLMFLGSVLFAPRHGVVSRAWIRFGLSLRILREDILGLLYRGEEVCAPGQVIMDRRRLRELLHAGPVTFALAVQGLLGQGRIRIEESGFRLTESGMEQAKGLIRDHRLWESYLHGVVNVRTDHTHRTSEDLEHITDAAIREELLEATRHPTRDPQGREIP
ncbi:MAG TPA: metal ABC transporter permease [Kiritimatiellia bacterium]|nr:metal ABC transporter permease [Kiritimatiellia bacterium]